MTFNRSAFSTLLAAIGLFTAVSAHAEEWLTLRPQDLAQYEITQANTVSRWLDGEAPPT
nr:hypothetical protein [uncultured Roseateles sp.]